jgi:TP901 family phage tail tape measure protein
MAAGSIVVDLLMKTGSFETDTKRAEKRSREMAREIDKAFKMVGAAVLAAGAAFVAMTKSIMDSADSMAKASRSIGISTESLSALQYAAELSGVSANELNQSLIRLNKSAADGNKAFDAMGISVRDAQGNLKATDTLLKEVSDRFSSYADGAAKSALAQEIFGRSGAQMISLLNEGSEGLSRMEAEAQRLGIVISGDLAKNSEALNDNLSKIALAAKGAAIEIAGPLIRALADVTTRFLEASNAGRGFWASLGVAIDPLQGVGGRSTIRDATKDIENLQKRIELMAATGATTQNNPIFQMLNLQLAQAKINLADLEKIQRLMGPAAPKGFAPMVGDQAAAKKQREIAQKEAQLTTDWLRGFEDANLKRQTDIHNKRLQQIQQQTQAGIMLYEATRTPLELLNIQEARLNELLQEGAINWDTYGRAIMMVNEQYEEATKQTKEFSRLADDMGMTIATAFENAILTGKKLSDTLRDLANDILRLVMRQTVTEPFAAAISGSIKDFMGFKANGGPVTGGGTYMVGERGPELFVPNTSGMIVPHEALQGSGGGVTVQQTINVTTGVQQTVRAEILTLMPQIANAAKAAVSDAKLRGGSYAAALR